MSTTKTPHIELAREANGYRYTATLDGRTIAYGWSGGSKRDAMAAATEAADEALARMARAAEAPADDDDDAEIDDEQVEDDCEPAYFASGDGPGYAPMSGYWRRVSQLDECDD